MKKNHTHTGQVTDSSHIRLTVPSQAVGQRLDKWLSSILKEFSRSRLKNLLEQGCVTLDGDCHTPLSAAQKVKAGESYTLIMPRLTEAEPIPQDIPLEIIYEDDHLVVVNKPAGMVVHPAPGFATGTLVNALLYHCGDSLSGIGGVLRPGIVHRIDKDTSGLLVVAKSDVSHHGLAAQFAEHSISRRYRAFCHKIPNPAQGRIEGNIGRHPVDRKKMAVVDTDRGKHAVTHYQTIQTFILNQKTAVSEIICQLETGRTHQIRVHMAHIGHSLIGDPVYSQKWRIDSSRLPALSKEYASFNRQALHAEKLGFIHPVTKKTLSFHAPLPYDMEIMLSVLKKGGV